MLPLQWAQVQFLIGEIWSHMQQGVAKKKWRKWCFRYRLSLLFSKSKHLNIVNVSIFLMAVTFRYLVVYYRYSFSFLLVATSPPGIYSLKQPFQNGLLSILTLCSPRRAKFCRYGNKIRKWAGKHMLTHTHTNIKHTHASTQKSQIHNIQGSCKKKVSCVNSLLSNMKNFVLSCLPSTN